MSASLWPSLALELSVKTTLIFLAAMFVRSRSARISAANRHLVWLAAFIGVAMLPLLTPWVPRLDLAFVQGRKVASENGADSRFNDGIGGLFRDSTPIGSGARRPTDVRREPRGTDLSAAETLLAAGWIVGFLLCGGRSVFGLLSLARRRRTGSRPWPTPHSLHVRPVAGARSRQNWELRVSDDSHPAMAMTWGLIRPVVLLPRSVDAWSQERLQAVLLHELAHVRRRDFASQLLAEVLCALYWFNPIVWASARSMREDAEAAADDVVLDRGIRPTDYARELLAIAASLGPRPKSFTPQGITIMSHLRIETRLRSILAPHSTRRGITTISGLWAAAAVLVGIPTFAAVHAAGGPSHRSQADSKLAATRLKQVAVATIIYANDYDDRLPYANSTQPVIEHIRPYARDNSIFQSPTEGGRFLYNVHLSGVDLATIKLPADCPMWREKLIDPSDPFVVAYTDGHVETLGSGDIDVLASAWSHPELLRKRELRNPIGLAGARTLVVPALTSPPGKRGG